MTNRRVTSETRSRRGSRGWFIDLVSPLGYEGEMQVTDSLIRNGHVIFTTLVPTGDPCENGGSSWLWELNLFTGARLPTTPWDLNDDGEFNDDDKVDYEGGVDRRRRHTHGGRHHAEACGARRRDMRLAHLPRHQRWHRNPLP